MLLLQHRGAFPDPKQVVERRMQVLLVVYMYDADAATFLPLPDMPTDLNRQLSDALQALKLIHAGPEAADIMAERVDVW